MARARHNRIGEAGLPAVKAESAEAADAARVDAFVAALFAGKTAENAAEASGIKSNSQMLGNFAKGLLSEAVAERADLLIRTELVAHAVKALQDALVHPNMSHRLAAVRLVQGWQMPGVAEGPAGKKPHEMTEAELAEMLRRMQAAREARTIDVEPEPEA